MIIYLFRPQPQTTTGEDGSQASRGPGSRAAKLFPAPTVVFPNWVFLHELTPGPRVSRHDLLVPS